MSRNTDKEQDYRFWREAVIAPLRSCFDAASDISLGLGITPLGKLHEVDTEYFPTYAHSDSLEIRTFEKVTAKELLAFAEALWKQGSLDVAIHVGWTWCDFPFTADRDVVVRMARPWYAFHLNRLTPEVKRGPFPAKELNFLCMSRDPRAAVPGLNWLTFRSCKVSPVSCEETPKGFIFEVHTEQDAQKISTAYACFEGLPECKVAVTRNRQQDAAFPYRVAVSLPA